MNENKITMLEASTIVLKTQDQLLSVEDVAEALGVKVASLRVYSSRASKSRMEATSTSADLPLPDYRFGRSPLWHASTIKNWRGSFANIG